MKIIIGRDKDFCQKQNGKESFACDYAPLVRIIAKKDEIDLELSNQIDDFFDKNDCYNSLQCPYAETPDVLKSYQSEPQDSNLNEVNDEINRLGKKIGRIQILHGGNLGKKSFITERPLSTTVNPLVAFREAEKNAQNSKIYINILETVSPFPKAFVFDANNGELSHEREILFESSLYLQKISEEKISNDYKMYDLTEKSMLFEVYLVKWLITKID